MLSVNKINNYNISYRSHSHFNEKFSDYDPRLAYLDMNKDACKSFVDGDISLGKALKEKWNNFWRIAFNEDPTIVIKSQMIEESLRKKAFNNLVQNTNTSLNDAPRYDFVA